MRGDSVSIAGRPVTSRLPAAPYTPPMDTDLASMLVSARAAATQQAAMLKIIKKTHEMQLQLVQMVSDAARSDPPPGQGRVVDKLA